MRPSPRYPEWFEPLAGRTCSEDSAGNPFDGMWGSNISPTSKLRGELLTLGTAVLHSIAASKEMEPMSACCIAGNTTPGPDVLVSKLLDRRRHYLARWGSRMQTL